MSTTTKPAGTGGHVGYLGQRKARKIRDARRAAQAQTISTTEYNPITVRDDVEIVEKRVLVFIKRPSKLFGRVEIPSLLGGRKP